MITVSLHGPDGLIMTEEHSPPYRFTLELGRDQGSLHAFRPLIASPKMTSKQRSQFRRNREGRQGDRGYAYQLTPHNWLNLSKIERY